MTVPMIRYFNCYSFRDARDNLSRQLFRRRPRTGRRWPCDEASGPKLDDEAESPWYAGRDYRVEDRAHELPLPEYA